MKNDGKRPKYPEPRFSSNSPPAFSAADSIAQFPNPDSPKSPTSIEYPEVDFYLVSTDSILSRFKTKILFLGTPKSYLF